MRCIVHGCMNYDHQGEFIDGMCSPCYTYITTGEIGPTTSFLSRYKQYEDAELDLVNAKEKKVGWISLYEPDYCGRIYKTYEEAKKEGEVDLDYITTVKIEWEE